VGLQRVSKPGRRNLAVAAQRAFDRFGDRESVFHDVVWHRSGRLHERSLRLAGGLTALGLRPGDPVVVFLLNSPTVDVCYSALWRAGAVITPAIFIMAPAELQGVLADSCCAAVITSSELLPGVRAAAAGVGTLRWIISEGGGEGAIPLDQLEAGGAAALMYTGGTTGRARGLQRPLSEPLEEHDLSSLGVLPMRRRAAAPGDCPGDRAPAPRRRAARGLRLHRIGLGHLRHPTRPPTAGLRGRDRARSAGAHPGRRGHGPAGRRGR
jgi:hypothetical protein